MKLQALKNIIISFLKQRQNESSLEFGEFINNRKKYMVTDPGKWINKQNNAKKRKEITSQ